MQDVSFTTECLDHELKIAVSIYPSNRLCIFRIMRQEKLSLNSIHSNIKYFIIARSNNIGSALLHMSIIKANHVATGRFIYHADRGLIYISDNFCIALWKSRNFIIWHFSRNIFSRIPINNMCLIPFRDPAHHCNADVMNNELVARTKAKAEGHIVYLSAASWYLADGGYTSMNLQFQDIEKALGLTK